MISREIKGRITKFDEEDLGLFEKFKWYVANTQWPYLIRTERHSGDVKAVLFHREVMQVNDGMMIDHINGDTLDNRKKNLRICTHAENMRNRRMHANNRTGMKGVYVEKKQTINPFVAQIRVDGKKRKLGSFPTAELAHAAYQKAAKEMHGRFSRGE